jgi:hypothetical protein
LADTVGRFIDDYAKANRTWQESERILRRYVVPELADKNVEFGAVDAEDLIHMGKPPRTGKAQQTTDPSTSLGR